MRCGIARRLLWPGASPQVVTPVLEEAEAHLRACDECRRFVADQRALAEQIRRLARRMDAPAAVRERVFDALARERALRSSRPARTTRVAAAALIVAATLGSALWVMRPDQGDGAWRQRLAAVAEDHARAGHEESIVSSDAGAVEQWLNGRVPFAVHIPLFPEGAFEGARLCYMDGRRGAVLRYRVDGREVSYYVMPGGSFDSSPPDPAPFLKSRESGYEVVAWREAGLIHALVGNLPEERLLSIARFCIQRPAARLDRRQVSSSNEGPIS